MSVDLSRTAVLVGLFVGVVVLAAVVGWSIANPSQLPLSTAADVLAGVGTFAVALVALYGMSTDSRRRMEERNDRRADRAPNLDMFVVPTTRPHSTDPGQNGLMSSERNSAHLGAPGTVSG
jgi:hypothetical protein